METVSILYEEIRGSARDQESKFSLYNLNERITPLPVLTQIHKPELNGFIVPTSHGCKTEVNPTGISMMCVLKNWTESIKLSGCEIQFGPMIAQNYWRFPYMAYTLSPCIFPSRDCPPTLFPVCSYECHLAKLMELFFNSTASTSLKNNKRGSLFPSAATVTQTVHLLLAVLRNRTESVFPPFSLIVQLWLL